MSSYVGRGGGPAPNESLVKACLSGALGKVLEAAKDKWGDAVSSSSTEQSTSRQVDIDGV